VYALHSRMSELDYAIEPEVEYPDNDATFVRATATIGGCDAVEEYVACKIYPLAASFGFESVPLGTTPVSKVETPLLLFAVGTIATELVDHFLAEVEIETERVLWSFEPREYNALRVVNISNDGRLNCVLEQIGGVVLSPSPTWLHGLTVGKQEVESRGGK
jgi:hypothetical protein